MTRTSLAMLDARRSLRIGLGALLAFVSAAWLGAVPVRGDRKMRQLEAQVVWADGARPRHLGSG